MAGSVLKPAHIDDYKELDMNAQRVDWIDIAKGIAIFLVVFGHTLRGGVAQCAVYGFHVPLFFVIAGMAAHFSQDRSKKIQNDFKKIMVPYYIWGIASIFVYLILGSVAGNKLGVETDMGIANNLFGLFYASPRTHLMRFNLPLWFLPCLFSTKVVFYTLKKIFGRRNHMIFGISMIFAVAGFLYSELKLPALPFAFEIAVKMLPFFVIGNWVVTSKHFLSFMNGKKIYLLLVGIMLLTGAILVAISNPKINYSSDSFPNIPAFIFAALLGSSGIVLISGGIVHCKLLSYLGKIHWAFW